MARLDAHREQALALLRRDRSESDARILLGGWRLFFLSTREIWGYRRGDRWLVSHYLLEPRAFGGSGTKPDVRSTYSS